MIVVATGGSYTARWYDGALRPASASFAIGGAEAPSPSCGPSSAAARRCRWTAPGSRWPERRRLRGRPSRLARLACAHDLQIIRRNTAYALIPKSGASPRNALELFSGAGERCGAVTFPTEGLSMGMEGTVIGSSGEGGCTHDVWSGLLR